MPDFLLWFYLAFAVSSTMLPSASDRRAWLPLGLVAALLLGISLAAGAGPWLLANAAPWVNRGLEAAALVLAISLGLHLVLLPPFWLARHGLDGLSRLWQKLRIDAGWETAIESVLRERVTSKGGTTHAALTVLEAAGSGITQ